MKEFTSHHEQAEHTDKSAEHICDQLVCACMKTLKLKNPATHKHCERVACLSVNLALAVNKVTSGIYASLQFTTNQIKEIKYAALLHDFGKICVREEVLNKEKKLLPHEIEKIQTRFESFRDQLHLHLINSYVKEMLEKKQEPRTEQFTQYQEEMVLLSKKLSLFLEDIQAANDPKNPIKDWSAKIAQIAQTPFKIGSKNFSLLTHREIEHLNITDGTLNHEERLEMESHVTHSYEILAQFPWPENLSHIPEIAYCHHERLDGSGYPRQLKAAQIPLQAKLMAIADVFDALVDLERPYKVPLSYEKALDILHSEVKIGKLDGEFFRIFVEAKIGKI